MYEGPQLADSGPTTNAPNRPVAALRHNVRAAAGFKLERPFARRRPFTPFGRADSSNMADSCQLWQRVVRLTIAATQHEVLPRRCTRCGKLRETVPQSATNGGHPPRIEDQKQHVARTIAGGGYVEETRRRVVGHQNVPVTIHRDRGKGLMLANDPFERADDAMHLRCVPWRLWIHRRVAR